MLVHGECRDLFQETQNRKNHLYGGELLRINSLTVLMPVLGMLFFYQYAIFAETATKTVLKNPETKTGIENLVIFDKDHSQVGGWSQGASADQRTRKLRSMTVMLLSQGC